MTGLRQIGPRLRFAVIAALALLVATTVARIVAAIVTRGEIDPVSEVWIALAFDVANGVVYRPLLDANGYGGTRYFPLHFLLHGALLRFFGDAVLSGYVVTLASLCMLMAVAYMSVRRAGLSCGSSAAVSILFLASAAVQIAAVAMKSDLLPAALALAGFFCCERASAGARWWLAMVGGVLFGLAFLAKVTSIAGPLAGVAILLFAGRSHLAGLVVATTVTTAGLGIVGIQFASEGRFLSILAACAGGGTGIQHILRAPYSLLKNVWSLSFVSIPLSVIAAIALPASRIRLTSEPWSVYLVCVFAMTLALHAAYGVDTNHLVDLEVASALWLAVRLAKNDGAFPLAAGGAVAVAFIAALNLLTAASWGLLRRPDSGTGAAFATAAALAKSRQGPILSVAPIVPVLAGQRPFLLDPWMFQHLEKTKGGFTRNLQDRIRRQEFSAVVLRVGLGAPNANVDEWLGNGTLATIEQAYPERRNVGGLEVRLRPVESESGITRD